jgi:cytochrome c biogenesis protein CcdA
VNALAPENASKRSQVFAIIVAVGVAGLFLGLLSAIRNTAEPTVASIAGILPFGWAFAAGMVASVNPCGFFMLPAYLSYQLSTPGDGSPRAQGSHTLARGLRALLLGLAATSGFVVVMAAAGVLIGAVGQQLVRGLPYAGVAVGVALAGLGVWLLSTHRTLGIAPAGRLTVTPRRGLSNVFLFGIAYAVGSLSCTLPIFLLVAGNALSAGSLAASLAQFVSFGLGMGIMLIVVTIGAAFFHDAVSHWLRRLLPYVHRTSAMFLVAAGAYLVYYWVVLSGFIL